MLRRTTSSEERPPRREIVIDSIDISDGLSGILSQGDANTIQGNYIGTNAAGTARSTKVGGILLFSTPGQHSSAERLRKCRKRHFRSRSVSINTFGGGGHTIEGNIIGLDATGTVVLGVVESESISTNAPIVSSAET